MKTNCFRKQLPLFLTLLMLGGAVGTVRARTVGWVLQSFQYNTCGWIGLEPVTLTFDPTQSAPGTNGGACRVSTDFAAGSFFRVYGDYVGCCGCMVHVMLNLSNYYSVDFDVKWDNSSAISLSNFNASPFGGPGLILAGSGPNGFPQGSDCYSNVVIPYAATNGWVHISAPIDHALPQSMLGSGIIMTKPMLTGLTGTAAFWLANVELIESIPATQAVPLAVSVSGAEVTLGWDASPGATYTVQKTLDFSAWTTLATGYPVGGAPGGPVSYTDSYATNSAAFYRIRSP